VKEDKFTYTEKDVADGGIKLFLSVEDAINAERDATRHVAEKHGFDTIQELPESYLCGKHSTAELVEVFLDGTWEYRDATDDEVKTETGNCAQTLDWFLQRQQLK
jgi:hypothetical protein